MLHRKYPRVPLADLEDAYSRTVADLFTNPGRLAEVDPDFSDGSEFMQLLVNAASKDVLDLLRSQGRRGEATVGDFEQDRRRGDVNASEIDWKDGNATAAGTAAQQFLENRIDTTSDTDSARAEGNEAHRLLEYLAAIPEADRTIAAMVLEGMKPRHIAAQVGMTAKEVSRSWERAQGRLRTMLANGIDETRLCGLIADDLMRMREDGTITPALRQHIRNCEGCAFMVREQVGSKAAAIIGIPLPLPLAGAGGGAAWWMLGRHARRAASGARHLLGSASSSAGGQATTVAAKVAVAAAVTVPTATVAVVATHALTHHHSKPPVHHVVVTTPTKPVAPVVTTPVVTTPTTTAPAKAKPKVTHKHKPVHHKRKRRVLKHTVTTATATTTPAVTSTATYTPPPATVTTTATTTPPTATHTTTTTAPKTATHTSPPSSGSSLSGGGLPTPSQSNVAP